jgi:hypothetical protein
VSRAPAIVRELVRHLGEDRRGLDLLNRLLEDIDITLAPLVPPPPALIQAQAPEVPPEPVFAQPKPRRRRGQ